MTAVKLKPPEDIVELIYLVRSGRLFEVQTWIKSGRRVRITDIDKGRFCPLCQAVEAGFHSMVEVLLGVDQWDQVDLNRALIWSVQMKRTDLAELLLDHGASAAAVDFADVCRTVQPEFMEKLLRGGSDPAAEDAFACVLDEIKARPLLRFLRSLHAEFPVLRAQASLALAVAADQKKARWVALLVWAGADPYMKVPGDLQCSWDFDEDGVARTAAEAACWSGSGEVVKALQLKKESGRLPGLLERAAHSPSVGVIKELLRKFGNEELNSGDPPSCPAVEQIIEYFPFLGRWGSEAADPAACLELLLTAGARWHPDESKILRIRRNLLQSSPQTIVRVIRLLLYTPRATDPKLIAELSRTAKIRAKIGDTDSQLLRELDQLRPHPGALPPTGVRRSRASRRRRR